MFHQASTNALHRLNCSARLGTAQEFCAAMAQVHGSDAAGEDKYWEPGNCIKHAMVTEAALELPFAADRPEHYCFFLIHHLSQSD